MTILTEVIILLITGAAVGFASGMLGVGGCFIMVPVQYWILQKLGVDPTIAIRVAFGTNLMVVLPTSISGAITHNRKGAVRWKQGILLGISAFAGSFLGAYIASKTPGAVLTKVFGIAVVLGAIRMATAKPMKQEKEIVDNVWTYIICGVLLGIVSGIIGIGGGVLMVPVMVLALRFKMHEAIGTSMVMMAFSALGGAISYMVNGLGIAGLPPYSTGYVNWVQFGALAATSIPFAAIGSLVSHKVPAKQLKLLFAIVFLYMGLKMIGVFQWLHLPI
ncbi:hypothetical protein TKV_c19540 [Thermoanaerobacter kivui]|uniref:Probable membrane transporter protein n=1 Tax=Thermoanaerobacter kivui TaxID=2325 RepID=A0A097ATF8_THEKI|nr:sulfite exporter TauE/SafE family protein [Thermoanaerobacter kivui]AIS53098.1 hypothetical protein TKV_c19540 [Thermoanaerobacter kivui]